MRIEIRQRILHSLLFMHDQIMHGKEEEDMKYVTKKCNKGCKNVSKVIRTIDYTI
jgi:hypothetical protein